jgi:hypothetical protein
MKIRLMEAELFHADRRTDYRTDMTKPIVDIYKFANVPNKIKIYNCIKYSGP